MFALIYNEKQELLLCLRSDHELWNLPGGGLEDNESPWDGVVREVREEIGVDARVERLSGLYWRPEKNEVVYVFVCEISGEPQTSEEVRETRYFPVGELPQNVSGRLGERIADSLDGELNTKLRVQTGEGSIALIKKGLL